MKRCRADGHGWQVLVALHLSLYSIWSVSLLFLWFPNSTTCAFSTIRTTGVAGLDLWRVCLRIDVSNLYAFA